MLSTYALARSESYVIRIRLAQPPLGYGWSCKCILKPDQSKSFVRGQAISAIRCVDKFYDLKHFL